MLPTNPAKFYTEDCGDSFRTDREKKRLPKPIRRTGPMGAERYTGPKRSGLQGDFIILLN